MLLPQDPYLTNVDHLQWTHDKSQLEQDLKEICDEYAFTIHEFSKLRGNENIINMLVIKLNYKILVISRKYIHVRYSVWESDIISKLFDYEIETILGNKVYFKSFVEPWQFSGRKSLQFYIE